MDLHFTKHEPTQDEKEAVDGVPKSPGPDGTRRTHLLPVLHAIQSRIGWISPGALNYASLVLDVPPAVAFGVAEFYALLSTTPQPPLVVHVCDDIACKVKGADAICEALEREHGPEGSSKDGKGAWQRSPCLGNCDLAPAALVCAAGANELKKAAAPISVGSVLDVLHGAAIPESHFMVIPQAGQPALKLLRRIGQVDPASIDDYQRTGGFKALVRAFEMGRDEVRRQVIASKLLGRGGAAFPTGQKWQAAAAMPTPRYLVCNADESEPGTFKDRVLMLGDPFAVIESMIIAGFATGCEKGYLYIRGEYPSSARALQHAIRECGSRNILGESVWDTGWHFDIEVRIGAGAYICGEETAMLNSIEGNRGEPRNKPPFPTQVGLFGRPTVINNVETLVNIPQIVLEGGEAFAKTGTSNSTGTKLYCLSGHIARPGVYEAEFGITLREMLEMAGGVGGSGRLQAVLVGGAAGAFVGPDDLDMPLTFEGTRAHGATLGSAVIMPFDDTVDLRHILSRIAAFFRDESCGQCVPCRVGTVRQEELLHIMNQGNGHSHAAELVTLKEVGQAMRDASICGLGQTASSAIESALTRFRIFEGAK